MDVVITYVNGADPEWQRLYEQYAPQPAIAKRYRDWGTLRYLLRGIERNLPFVQNVFLVVSGATQVPEWASEKLRVVLHEDFIPAEFLPTFNSAAIEMFLHRIPGLGDRYIYFNDDIFPVLPCAETDFFRGSKAVLKFRRCLLKGGQFRTHTFNSDSLARRALGIRQPLRYLRPRHSATTFLRPSCVQAYMDSREEILRRISRVREDYNVNQYYYLDWLKLSGRTVEGGPSKKHFSLAVASEKKIRAFFDAPSAQLVCINDTRVTPEKQEAVQAMLLQVLEEMFPEKSRFEK